MKRRTILKTDEDAKRKNLGVQVYESNHESSLATGLIHGPCEVLPPSKFAEETGVRTRSRARGGDRSKTLFLSKCV
ncbi:hypothetical protein Tco_0596380 [Tanacetum coccineum]